MRPGGKEDLLSCLNCLHLKWWFSVFAVMLPWIVGDCPSLVFSLINKTYYEGSLRTILKTKVGKWGKMKSLSSFLEEWGRDQEERKPSIILVIVILDIHSVFRRRQVGTRERYSLSPLLCCDFRYPTVYSAMELGKTSHG